MRYRLRTLLIVLAFGPPVVAGLAMAVGLLPINSVVVAGAAYIGLVAAVIAISKFLESQGSDQAGSTNPYFESQAEAFDRQTKETDRLLAEQQRSVQRADDLMAKQESNEDRLGRLLDKMEDQVRRKDAILDAEEKQLGLR